MRIAVTGGTGFVGRHLAARLRSDGHEVVALGRGRDLAAAFAGCEAVVHCAGINREIGSQTYDAVHVAGTRATVDAARRANVTRIVMLSFLRARPGCGSAYHESKWAAEEIVRGSGLSWTILKAGVIYGRGDHMLDHLSRAFHTFPVFGLVGLGRRPMRPVAVDDVAQVLAVAATGDPRLAQRTFAIVGPDELDISEAVRIVAGVVGKRPVFVPLPIIAHEVVAALAERTMTVPLVSRAQVRILAEGLVEPLPAADVLPVDLWPRTPFGEESIRAGLPDPGGFGRRDLRWCAR
ncbi:MAG TPA: NAD(P)H-binding protein [Candidatus Limnocylindrales bacterium]|nr:NAD(P)H-binding protein [Candidatus Limnocylindrales bacterium]